jgi:hypothetical protein
MEPNGSLPFSQDPASGPFSEPDESSPQPHSRLWSSRSQNQVRHLLTLFISAKQRNQNHISSLNEEFSSICRVLTVGPVNIFRRMAY